MTISKSVLGAMSICAALFMGGCGGESSSSGGGAGLPALDVPAAEANTETGTEAADMVVGANYTSGIGMFSASSTSGKRFNPVSYVKQQVLKHNGIVLSSAEVQPAASQSFSEDCYDENYNKSGSISFSVSTNDAGTSGSATIVYNQCNNYGYGVLNGKVKMSVTGTGLNDYDYTLKTSKISFATDFSLMYDGSSYTIHQGTYVDDTYTVYDWDNDHYAGTETSSLWIDFNGNEHYRYDDLTVEFDDDEYTNNTMSACYKSGRIYVGNLTAYLDIDATYDPDCQDPFVWSSYMLESGSMELIGSNDSRVHVQATGSGSYTVTVTPTAAQ